MSPESPPTNPSQTVERIREIIVGRRLDHLENRVVRLENEPVRSDLRGAFDDRLTAHEAQLELLHEQTRRLAAQHHDDAERRELAHREEIQRVAAHIQQTAAANVASATQAATHLEQRLGACLGTWHQALQQHLTDRDSRLVATTHADLARLRAALEARLTATENQVAAQPDLTAHFARIAAAVRALADTIEPAPGRNRPPC